MKRWLLNGQPARNSKVSKAGAGYTIVEVMIVLAVTAALFAATAILFSGRHGRAMHTQSVRNFEGTLQTISNDVINGRYQGGAICNGVANNPGENKACMFLGKFVAARLNGLEVITVLTNRLGPTGTDITSLSQANLQTVATTQTISNTFGLEIRKIYELDSTGQSTTTQVGAFGFLSELGGGIPTDGSTAYTSGSRSLRLYGLNNSVAPLSGTPSLTAAGIRPLANGIRICLVGGNGQRAEVTIGANNSQTAIQSVILNNAPSGGCPGA